MSDGPFYPYIGLLILSGALLAVMAAAGFGQSRAARIGDAVFGAGFLGYAAYLWIANPDTVEVFFYAFAVPILAAFNVVRSRRRARAHSGGFAPPAYAPVTSGFPPAPDSAAFSGTPIPGTPIPGTPSPPAMPATGAPTGSGISQPVPTAPGNFLSAAALFAAPKQPERPEAPSVDPGAYRTMPSGLAGHDGHEQALPTARPSGLPAAGQETSPPTPAAPGTSPSGLPRRVPTYAEPAPTHSEAAPTHSEPAPTYFEAAPTYFEAADLPYAGYSPTTPYTTGPEPIEPSSAVPSHSGALPAEPSRPRHLRSDAARGDEPAHVEFTQRLIYPDHFAVHDQPAGPQPIYPAHPAEPPQPYRQAEHTERFAAPRDHRAVAGRHSVNEQFGRSSAQYFEQAQAGHATHADRYGPRHAGGHQPEEPFTQPGYHPAHGDRNAVDGQRAYPEEHPAEWPPLTH